MLNYYYGKDPENSLGLLAARPAQRSSRQDVLGSLRSHGALAKIRSSG